MINILMPIAGLAKSFTDHGYDVPKPLMNTPSFQEHLLHSIAQRLSQRTKLPFNIKPPTNSDMVKPHLEIARPNEINNTFDLMVVSDCCAIAQMRAGPTSLHVFDYFECITTSFDLCDPNCETLAIDTMAKIWEQKKHRDAVRQLLSTQDNVDTLAKQLLHPTTKHT
jgi:hypothetical protein